MSYSPEIRDGLSAIAAGCQKVIPAAAILLMASCAKDKFSAADLDNDGQIQSAEFASHMKKAVFEAVDANSDSMVSMEEWRVVAPDEPASKFKTVDSNGDGLISRAEGDAYSSKNQGYQNIFNKADTDKSGGLSRDEAKAAHEAIQKQSGSSKYERISNATHSK